MTSVAARYIKSGHRRVEGWLTDTAVAILPPLVEAQAAFDLTGPVCEVGVHHGRLFILLHLLAPNERAVGWDLFEDGQEANIDRSGNGNRAIARANLARHGAVLSAVHLHVANSMHLTPQTILQACGGQPRVFSIDGGHTAECTLNDLALASQTICDGGLVILDDVFNESWPGVLEGSARYFLGDVPRLVPAIIGGNKLICTTSVEYAEGYQEALTRATWGTGERLLAAGSYDVRWNTLFGSRVMSVVAYPLTVRRRLLRHRIARLLRRFLASWHGQTTIVRPRDELSRRPGRLRRDPARHF